MARRNTQTFSLSFLDVISCGFGAVVLFYTIISAQSGLFRIHESEDLAAEARRLEEQVLEGYKHLAELKNALERTDRDRVRTEGQSREVLERLRLAREELAKFQYDTLARRESLERLKADLRSLEEEARRLQAAAPPAQTGRQVRAATGDGDRQYLTGLKVGGQRILVLLDASASMLDETVVNVIRLRNMPDAHKLRADKWQQAVGTVDWIAAQLPPAAQFQIYAFNTRAWPLLAGSEGRWLRPRDASELGAALQALRRVVPADGTSLQNAFGVIQAMNPRPDNVILVTDGLPTQGEHAPIVRRLIDARGREDLMTRAVHSLPEAPPPINVVLLPMEGDPSAPMYFWRLARSTGGAFLSPARDWP